MIKRDHFLRSAVRTGLTTLLTSKRKATLLMAPLMVLVGFLLATIPTTLVSAAPPTMRWIDSATVEISHPDLKGTYRIKGQAKLGQGVAWYGEADVTHKDNCQLGFSAQVNAGEGGKEADYSKVMVWVSAPNKGKNCITDGPGGVNDYDLDVQDGSQFYTVADVNNRGNEGELEPPEQRDDPEDKQIIKLKLDTGWNSVFTSPDGNKQVPKEDLWILCGNAADPPAGWDPYRNNLGTPDYGQMEKDCLARKSGFVITTTRGPLSENRPLIYQGEFTKVRWGSYVVCDVITNSCQSVNKEPGKILTIDTWKSPANPLAEVPDASTDGEGAVEEPKIGCDLTFDLTTIFSLKWLVCPIIDTATFTVGKMEDVINNLLTVDTDQTFNDTDGNNAFHKAWNSFRFFALGLVVIAALVMVVAQAAGMDIFDAYTVRKLLPRLLFAAIFIALSWDILEFLVGLSNDAGQGIRTLIYAPFQELNKNNQLGGGSSFVLVLIGTGGALAFGWVGLLTFALTGLLAALVAFAVLVFRKILIYLLVIMAPFAIACYVLPNTQKVWDTWKAGIASVLIVFPIIMAFIAIGRVFSITSFNAPGDQTINQLIAVIAYFAPYFLISLAFRLAGGFVATVGGFVNDRSRGAFDRLKNARSRQVTDNLSKMGRGERFQGSNPLARTFNKATFGTTTFAKSRNKTGFLKDAEVRKAAFEQQRSLNAMNYAKSDAAQVAQHNDPLLQAQSYENEAQARANIARDFGYMNRSANGNYRQNEHGQYYRVADGTGDFDVDSARVESAVAAAKANGGWSRDKQINAVNRLFATGTGFDNLDQVHTAVSRVAGDNEALAQAMLGNGNAATKGVGRHDLAAGFGKQMQLYRQTREQGRLTADQLDDASMAALKGTDVVTMLRDKPAAMGNVMPALRRSLEKARLSSQDMSLSAAERDNATEEASRLAGIVESFQQSSMYAAPVNIQRTDELVIRPTGAVRQGGSGIREEIRQEANRVEMTRDATGKLVNAVLRDAAGNIVVDPATGQPMAPPNVTSHNPRAETGYNQQRPRNMYDPNDPRNG